MEPLDNPVWSALTTRHAHFNRGGQTLRYYPREVAPFIGMENWDEKDLNELQTHIPAGTTLSVPLTKQIKFPSAFEIIVAVPLYQMVCPSLNPVDVPEGLIRTLGDDDIPMMLELTAMTKPGPFLRRTIDFGNYIGIFQDGGLVAMAGDRMKTTGSTEVSAICTHPDHLGKRYASYLITRAAGRIVAAGDIPFLHVKTDNTRAVELYKKMGFVIRADISYTIFRKKA